MSELIALNYGINNYKWFQRTLEHTTPKIGPKGHESGPTGPWPRPIGLL